MNHIQIVIFCLSLVIFGCDKKPSTSAPNKSTSIAAPTDVAAPPSDAQRTASGLAFKILSPGDGTVRPNRKSRVTVHYSGWTTDGVAFDSSVARGTPSTFAVSQVIAGWTEVLQLMVRGERRRVWIPESLAYKGQKGMPEGMLVFDIELLAIDGEKTNPAPKVKTAEPSAKSPAAPSNAPIAEKPAADAPPKDVAAPPADAIKTNSGLASKVLVAGSGTTKPNPKSVVTLQFKGWTTDGKLFDSSRQRPARMPMDAMMLGLREGLQLMVVGEKRRLWVPEPIAYKGRPGYPKGTLVFDIELLKIEAEKAAPKAPDNVSGPPKDAIREETGLFSKVLKMGTGQAKPTDKSAVMVRYSVWTTDGTLVDTTEKVGDPAVFPIVRVVPGFSEGLKLMVAGEKRRLWVPERLAYRGAQGKPKGMLVYDVELIDLKEIPDTLPKNVRRRDLLQIPEHEHGDLNPEKPPSGFTECHDVHCHHSDGKVYSFGEVMKAMKARDVVGGIKNNPAEPPTDVAGPSGTVETTQSGIRHRLLFVHKKHNDTQPKIDSLVTFHFSGWTESGKSFLSSVLTGRPAKLPLVTIPSPGLVEAIQQLKVGEKRRFWIPEALTGRDKGMQVPAGNLTYDIELIDAQTL